MMFAFTWDGTLHLGDVLATAAWVVGFLALLLKVFIPMRDSLRDTATSLGFMRGDVDVLKKDVQRHQDWLTTLRAKDR